MKNSEDLNKYRRILNMQKNRKCNLPFFHEIFLKIAKEIEKLSKNCDFQRVFMKKW